MSVTKKTSLFLIAFFAAIVSAFAVMNVLRNGPANTNANRADLQRRDVNNKHLIDTAVSLLKSGCIVLRTGSGADSYLLAQMNRKDKTYSHCGIVMIEHGYPFVYHSIGGEDNPDERLRRDSASFFFSPLHNEGLAVVRYDYNEDRVDTL